MNHIHFRPKTRLERLTAGELPFELALAVGAASGPAFFAARALLSEPPEVGLAILGITIAAVVLITLCWRAVLRNQIANSAKELHALDGALETIHAILENLAPRHENSGLRICVFVPGREPFTVHQISNYAGSDRRVGAGRVLSSRCGVVGTAFRTGQAAFDKLPLGSNLVDHLVMMHGFERTEAAKMKQDCEAWAAIPIGDAQDVEAVIYLDCTKRNYFGAANNLKRKTLEAAIVGVAKFMART